MLLHIPRVLTESQIACGRALLEQAKWVDGRATAGHLSARAKHNLQVAEGTPEARELGPGDARKADDRGAPGHRSGSADARSTTSWRPDRFEGWCQFGLDLTVVCSCRSSYDEHSA